MEYRASRMRIGREGLGEPPREEDEAFSRWFAAMTATFGATILLSVALVMIDQEAPLPNRLLGSALVLFLVAWYWFRGQWTAIRSDLDLVVYFAVLITLVAIAINQHNAFALVLFTAYWQGFAYLRVPAALVYATVLTLASQWAFGSLRFDTLGGIIENPSILIIAFIALIVSGLLASYIETIAREADRRADLLRQLREAQQALAAREREAGISLERQRLAGEIHDTVAQHFTSIVTNLEAAESRAGTNPQASWDHIRAAREAARHGIVDARSMVAALQPEVLEGRSITDALRHITEGAASGAGVPAEFHEEGAPVGLDRLHETILVRALQEALQNIRKHANARTVTVTLNWLDDEVILDIQDDGVGFAPDATRPQEGGHRMGLRTMKQRVEGAGGTWMIDSTPGEGTSLAVTFPTTGVDRDTAEAANG